MHQHPEYQYLELLEKISKHGSKRMDRTGVGTKALFAESMRFDLQKGFPALTTKKLYWKTAFKEMLWMLNGGENIRELLLQSVSIWTEWPHAKYCKETGDNIDIKVFEKRIMEDEVFAQKWGSLNGAYGKQWRKWEAKDGQVIDQVEKVIHTIKNDAFGRRHIIEGYNVGEVEKMTLPPCHKTYQFFVDSDTNRLNLFLMQRSADAFLGLGFNLCNQALMLTLIAKEVGLPVGEISWTGVDVHLYSNHENQVKEQLSRRPRAFPEFVIKNEKESMFDYVADDFDLVGYDPHPAIKAPVAV